MDKLVLTESQEGGSKKMIASNDNRSAVQYFDTAAKQQNRRVPRNSVSDLGSISLSQVARCLIVRRSGMIQAPTEHVFKTSA